MCECVYCLGDKPWSGEPNDWPHTPPVHVFLTLQEQDPNLWWRMSSGHGQNIAEGAIDLCEELTNENKSIKHDLTSILTDLIAELVGDDGDGHEMTPDGEACAVCVAIDRAEARLREVGGDV